MNLRPLLQGWRDWLLLALCGAWLLALVWIGHPENDLLKALWSQTMAAWVQAVGSIGAVIGAIVVARSADRRANRLRTVNAVNASFAGMTLAQVAFERAHGHSRDDGWNFALAELFQRELQMSLDMLNRVPLPDLPGETAAGSVVKAIRLIHMAEIKALQIAQCLQANAEKPRTSFELPIKDMAALIAEVRRAGKSALD